MVRIRSLVILFQILFAIHNISFPQSLTEETKKDSTGKDKALEFYFLNEQSLAFRSSISENFYWKAELDVSASFADTKEERYGNKNEHSISQAGIDIGLQIFTSIYSNDYWSIDIGVGPSITYSMFKANTFYVEEKKTIKYEDFSTGYGAQATLLAQLNLNERIFLISKYEYVVHYIQTEHTSDEMQILGEQPYTTSWFSGISGMRMGIGIYF